MKRFCAVTLLIATVMIAGSVASAAPLSRILKNTGLSPDDFALLGTTERRLYETAAPQPGKVVSWANPDTNSHGTVRLAALRQNCAYIQHMVYPKGATQATELRNRMCRGADGIWRLTP